MVLSSVVTSLINQFLSPFLDEMSADQLSLFSLSGRTTLLNLALKPTALDALKLPVRVVHGTVGRIEVEIPWLSLYSSPITVHVSDVYVVALPNWEVCPTEEEEAAAEWKRKKAALDSLAELKAKLKEQQEKPGGGPPGGPVTVFAVKFGVAAVKNVQVTVENVHIVFEDSTTASKSPLQVGVSFARLRFETEEFCRGGGRRSPYQQKDLIIHKVVSLEGFSVYMNTEANGNARRLSTLQPAEVIAILKGRIARGGNAENNAEALQHLEYILCPMTFRSMATMHCMPWEYGFRDPMAELVCRLEHFCVQLSARQAAVAGAYVAALGRIQLAGKYRKWMPNAGKDPAITEVNAEQWWKFLQMATVSARLRTRKETISWPAIERCCAQRKTYCTAYKVKLLGEEPAEDLEALERKLSLAAIILAREQAEAETKEIQNAVKRREEAEAKKGGFWGGLARWFGLGKSGDDKEEDEKKKQQLLTLKKEFDEGGEEKAKLYQAIGYDESKDGDGGKAKEEVGGLKSFFPPEYVAVRARLEVTTKQVVVREGGDELLNLKLAGFTASFALRPSSGNITLKAELASLGAVGLREAAIIKSGSAEQKQKQQQTGIYGYPPQQQPEKLLQVSLEVNPMDKQADLTADLKMKTVQLLYDAPTFGRLLHALMPAIEAMTKKGDEGDVHLHQHVSGHRALKEAEIASMRGGASAVSKPPAPLDEVAEHHKQIWARVQVEPLSVIIPDSGSLETATKVLILTLGKVIVTSELMPKAAVEEAAKEMMAAASPAGSIAPAPAAAVPRTDSLDQKTVPKREEGAEGEQAETKSVASAGQQVLQQQQLEQMDQQVEQPPPPQRKVVVAKYGCQLKSIQVVMSDAGRWEDDIRFVGVDTERHIVHPLEIDISVELSLIPSGMAQLLVVTFSDITVDLAPQLLGTALDIVGTLKVFSEKPEKNVGEEAADQANGQTLEISNTNISVDFQQPKPIARARAWFLHVVRPPHWDEEGDGGEGDGGGDGAGEVEPMDPIFKLVLSERQVILIRLDTVKLQIRQCVHAATPVLVLSVTSVQASMIDGKRLTFGGQVGGEYFNKAMRAWEPLIETVHGRPFAFEGAVSLAEKGIVKVRLVTVESLELLISKSLVGVLLNLAEVFQAEMAAKDGKKKKGVVKSKLEEDCILIRNHLGISLVLDLVKSGLEGVVPRSSSSKKGHHDHHHEKKEKSYRSEVIKSGGEMQFKAKNVAIVELVVKLQFSEVHVIGRTVACSVSSTRCYFTELKSARNESFKWIVQVTDHGTSKEVDFRSHLQLVNTFDRPFTLYSYDGKKASALGSIGAEATISLPLPLVFGENFLYLRPSSDFHLSDTPVDWHSLDMGDRASSSSSSDQPKVKQLLLGCGLKADKEHNTSFTVKVRGQRSGTALYEDTDHHSSPSGVEDACALYTVSLLPLVRLRNQLPYSVQYHCRPMEAGQMIILAPGDETNLPYAVFGKSTITLKLVNYLGRNWKAAVHLPESGGLSEDHYYRFTATGGENMMSPVVVEEEDSPKKDDQVSPAVKPPSLKEGEAKKEEEASSKETITLAVNFAVEKHSLVLSIFAPFWAVNQTPLHVAYKVHGSSSDEDEGIFSHPDSLGETGPFLLAFDPAKVADKDHLALSVAGSDYSTPFPLNIVPYTGSVLPPPVMVPVEKLRSPSPKPAAQTSPQPVTPRSQVTTASAAEANAVVTEATQNEAAEGVKKEEEKAATVEKKFLMRVHVQLAAIGRSKILTVHSFYNVYNVSQSVVQYSEEVEGSAVGQWSSIGSKAASSCFFPQKTANQTMVFRFEGREEFVSKPVSLRSSSQTLLPIGDAYLFVEVVVSEEEVKIKLSDYFYGAAPVLLINDLSVPVLYGQKDVTEWGPAKKEGEEDGESDGRTPPVAPALGREVSLLPPKQMSFFCWLDPMGTRQLVYRIPQMPIGVGCSGGEDGSASKSKTSKEDVISLDFDKYQPMDDQGMTGWVTFFDGKQRVLIFTENPELPQLLLNTEELIKPKFSLEVIVKGVGLNIVNEEKKKDLLYMSIRSSCVWEGCEPDKSVFKPLSLKESALLEEMYQLHLGSRKLTITHKNHRVNFLEMRMIAPRPLTLQRLTNRAVWLHLSAAEHITQLHLKVASVQVDNQLPDHVYAVVLCPVEPPREVIERNDQLTAKSFVEVSAIVQSLAGSKVTRIKYAQVLVQEFLVQGDLGWAVQFIDLLPEGFELGGKKSDQARIKEDLEEIAKNDTLVEMQHFGMGKTYYDYLLLGPMKLHLSVTMGDLPEGKMPAFVDTAVRFTGLTLAEINGTLFKLDYFERTQWACSNEELIKAIAHHYALQIAAQLYKLILGLDIIGNPGKLASDITRGVGDFFYEPAAGIVVGPEEFAEGVATGVHSLTTNLVGGTAAALGRIGHRLGTGVAALSADEKFQKERRERTNKEATFSASGKHLVRGFVDGVSGLVSKPVEGAQRSGFGGLLRGVGQGLVGVIVQPATGVLDAAATGLHAFNNSIDAKTVARAARPPRHFPAGSKLLPYNLYAAIGNQHLRTLADGKYAAEGEEYEYHLQLDGQRMVLLSTTKIFYLEKSMFAGAWEIDWSEDWMNVQEATGDGDRLSLTVKMPPGTGGGFCFFGGGTVRRTIVDRNEEHIRELYGHVRRHVEGGGSSVPSAGGGGPGSAPAAVTATNPQQQQQ